MKTINLIKASFQKVLEEMKIDLSNITLNIKKIESVYADYYSDVALSIAGKQQKNPMIIAEQIAEKLMLYLSDKICLIKIAKPGFINILLSDAVLVENLLEILNKKQKYCSGFIEDSRIYVVEYSSPNIAKPFTVGHLRSTIIGNSIARILLHSGHNVIQDNHLGDWGTQFGKMMVALKKWGNVEEIKNSENPVKELVSLYQKFHQKSKEEENTNNSLINEAREWFVKLEKGDTEARELWKFCVDCSMKEFNLIYIRLGVEFDTCLGESFFEDKMHFVFSDIKKGGIGKISEGALVIFFLDNFLPPLLVRKKDGSTLYATRDLATDLYRLKKYGSDVVIINEVGKEQKQYFEQIFETERMLGYFKKGQRIHVKHGLYRFPDGKMSTREGNVVWLDEVLNEAVEKALLLCDGSRESAEIIAIGALKFNDLLRDSESDITFSWEKILNMKGDSGPYVQYAAVRSNSLIKKAFKLGMKIPSDLSFLEWNKDDREILRVLEAFFEALNNARINYSSSNIASYLIKLSREYNKYYSVVNVIKDKNINGLVISYAVREVLQLGLSLLGIYIPKKM